MKSGECDENATLVFPFDLRLITEKGSFGMDGKQEQVNIEEVREYAWFRKS